MVIVLYMIFSVLYDFSVDSSPITTEKILDIHNYLMKKNKQYNIKFLGLLKKHLF